jgi:hypothetical protein
MIRRTLFALAMALSVIAAPSALLAAPKGDQPSKPSKAAPRISERFAGETEEVPDFRKHVVPLLGKLGCNGRACHGSFQGQGGFRLSLFGYDFKLDHENLTGGDYSRVDTDSPADSMFIMKPTMVDPHEGGLRYKPGSWEHKVFLAWAGGGAKSVDEKTPEFVRLDVTPSEILFSESGQTRQLTAVAVWSDGSREDVTDLCRFQTNNSSVAEVGKEGLVTATDPGDTHVVVFYDNGVVPVPVIRPVSGYAGPNYPNVPTPTAVDRLVVEKLQKLGVVPSELADDATFLRRVRLDLTGTLPTAGEVRQFLSDSSPDKRERKIEELLESSAYAAWWTTRLCDITGNNDDQLNNITPVRGQASQDWYDWIYSRVAKNTPYDELMAGLVMADSRDSGESYRDYCKAMSEIAADEADASAADRESMPYYWARRNFRLPEDRVIGFAYTFLGIRIQCAQCHKHPFDQWTQDDFKDFTGFFTYTQFGTNPETREESEKMLADLGLKGLRGGDARRKVQDLAREGKVVPMQELYTRQATSRAAAGRNNNRRPGGNQTAQARVLGGEMVDLTKFEDPREPLMAWLRSKDNPYFARAFVNRVWATYFNVGIVNPPDDLSLANPASNKPLLDYLTEGFIESGYDMKWLHRTILGSRTYQLSWEPNETNRGDEKNFSRAVPRRLPAEVAVDALTLATLSDEAAAATQAELDGRAIAIAGAGRRNRNGNAYALQIFGRSIRESNCDCDRSMDASLLQTVYLQNDADVLSMIDRRGGWLQEAARDLGVPFSGQTVNSQPSREDRDRAERLRRDIAQLQQQAEKLRDKGDQKEARKLTEEIAARRRQLARLVPSSNDRDDERSSEQPQKTKVSDSDLNRLVEDAYLRTVGRLPTGDERRRSLEYVAAAENQADGLRGVLWALLNTKEFIVNH